MKGRALHKRMSQRRRCVAQRFKLQTNTVSLFFFISEFTQQDSRKKRTANRLSVTNVTGLLLACFAGNSLNMVFLPCYKKICLKECEVWRKVFSNKIIVTLFTQGLPSSFLFRPVAMTTTLNPLDLKEFSFNQRGQSLFK